MSQIDINGNRFHYIRSGSGPPIVLLHGFTGSVQTWTSLQNVLENKFEVISIDMVGHGLTDSPTQIKHYRMSSNVNDLVTLVNELGHMKAIWLGYSMGARSALQIAIQSPSSVSGLVLEGVSPGLIDKKERSLRIQSDEKLADDIESFGIENFVNYWEAIPLWQTQVSLSDDVKGELHLQRLQNNPLGLANSLRGMGTGAQSPIEDISEIKVPVLFVCGSLDNKFCDIARKLLIELDCGEFNIVEGAGHAVHLERPDEFNALVLKFLNKNYWDR